MRFLSAILLATALLAPITPALSQEGRGDASTQRASDDGVLSLLPADSVTERTMTIGGRQLDYVATAGTLDLFAQDGSKTGAIFYTAYVAKNGSPDRPLTFAFNGGPGAASAFLQLGLVGPRILDFGPKGDDGADA